MDEKLIKDAEDSLLFTNYALQLTIPSVLEHGETFDLRIRAIGPDSLPTEDFKKTIFFGRSPGIAGLPKSFAFSPDDKGFIVISNLEAVGPDYAYVVVTPEGSPMPICSNPAWVMHNPPYRVFWGDLHVHTTYSNCSAWACKDPEFCYAYARDVACLDFCAAADHLRGIASEERRWSRLQELVRLHDDPDRFVPFLAFESSHKTGFGGDNNIYYLGSDAPYFWLDRKDMRGTTPEITLRQLWDFLDATGEDYFTVPHHTGRASKYRSFAESVYDPKREPVFEIYSGWGSSECRWNRFPLSAGNSDEPCYFVDALKAGCRYGVIASSDDHCTLPGGEHVSSGSAGSKRLSNHVHSGLAAVRAPDLSRESLWNAVMSRNCYGTTLARVLLDLTIGDIEMGQEAQISETNSLRKIRHIRVKVMSTEPAYTDVVLVRNGEDIAKRRWEKENPEIVFEDTDKLDDIVVRDAQFHPSPFVVYYVRVENRFDQTQWSSPIWLDL
ncbi:hypothetical protein ACFLQR_04120 [Verrucomicrobiota bacterium]